MTLESGRDFEQLLEFLRQARGFDFTGYKRSTLVRRVGKRAQQLGLDDFGDYLDYLQVHPDEFPILFNTILINVTEFFRDKTAWDYLSAEIIPRLAAKEPGKAIRVWSAGCASGEEAYSVAILLSEALGPDRYLQKVKVYATDIDEDALSQARNGYPPEAVAQVPTELVEKYFDLQGGRYSFKPALRRTIIFGRHDLLQDAPISRIDLLMCRNTLMYFTAESQARILARFHYALNDGGFLFLGRAEMLLTHGELFTAVDLKNRVFGKVPRVHLRDRLTVLAQASNPEAANVLGNSVQLWELGSEHIPIAQVILDNDGRLAAANRLARSTFGLSATDIGRPFKDLELSYQPAELRSRVTQALKTRVAVEARGVEHTLPNGATAVFDIELSPLLDETGGLAGVIVQFRDVSETRRLHVELERVRHEVETANEELQSSNEELETTNEELQSTVEELETTNEELQSSNEELETMNEELESTNAELQTINADLRQRTDDVDRLNAFLEGILASLQVGIAVLDRELVVVMWNARSHDLWGVREDEAVGKDLFSLDIGLPLDGLQTAIREVVNGERRQLVEVVEATNRRGRAIKCRVSAIPLASYSSSGEGLLVVMEELSGS